MRAYIAHNMDGSEDLRTRLETIESKVVATWKLAKKRASLLRKAKEEKEAAQDEACRLAKKKKAMEAGKKKAEEEAERLRQELQELRVGFVVQKEELEAEYKKQEDNMFFYGYRCCMKKHGIAQDTSKFPSGDEDEALSSLTRGGWNAFGIDPSSRHAWPCIYLLWPDVAQTTKFVKTLDTPYIWIYLLYLFASHILFPQAHFIDSTALD